MLGPKLYCIYTKPVGDIVKKHNLRYHCYADDTQIYLSIKLDENWASERSAIEACVADVGGWMNRNMLKTEPRKKRTHCVFVQTPNSSGEQLVPHDRRQTITCCAIREKSWSYYGERLDYGETGECDLQVLFLPHPKYNTFTYKVLNGLAPAYMSDIVQKHQPTRSLRSTEKSLLVVPVLRTATYGERCFSRHAAILWNDLPENIKQETLKNTSFLIGIRLT